MSEPVLRVAGLEKRYSEEGHAALAGVTFDVLEGEFLAIVGQSGGGKTTLLRLLCGLIRPTAGTIHLDGRLVTSPPREAAIVFQDYSRSLFPWMTVRQNVMVGVHCRTRSDFFSNAVALPWVGREERATRGEADDLLAFLALERVADHPAAGLPYGTLKRVELARALAGRPALLLADEPAAGLNHEEVGALGSILKSIRDERGVTILLVEHHMGLVMQVSDRVVVLDFGRKIAEGPPAEIQRNADVIRAYLGGEDAETAFR